ncbi:uncharacterized protein TNCV_2037501 [Trichonephila clavipes]|nr:uncharacterized protein TNCV_2037501 [Trichonephila clavipes]
MGSSPHDTKDPPCTKADSCEICQIETHMAAGITVDSVEICQMISDADCGVVLPGFESRRRLDVCKCIVLSRHMGTLNNRRATIPFVRLVEREERREAPDHLKGVLPQNWGGTEQNHTITCMVLKAKANDRRKNLPLSRDEFRGP